MNLYIILLSFFRMQQISQERKKVKRVSNATEKPTQRLNAFENTEEDEEQFSIRSPSVLDNFLIDDIADMPRNLITSPALAELTD